MLASFLNKTCNVFRPVQTAGSIMAETTAVLSAVATAVPCTVQVKSSSRHGGPAQGGEEVYEAYFFPGQNVRAGDLLSGVTDFTNYQFWVESDPLDDAGRRKYFRFDLTHRQGGGIR